MIRKICTLLYVIIHVSAYMCLLRACTHYLGILEAQPVRLEILTKVFETSTVAEKMCELTGLKSHRSNCQKSLVIMISTWRLRRLNAISSCFFTALTPESQLILLMLQSNSGFCARLLSLHEYVFLFAYKFRVFRCRLGVIVERLHRIYLRKGIQSKSSILMNKLPLSLEEVKI